MSPSKLVEILRAEGVTVHEVRSWRTHNRNSKGPWGPVNGVMIHHTVTSGTDSSVDICYNGYSGLPGPLCHGVIDKLGHVHLVSGGRANHAGLGDPDVLRAVIDERVAPADNEATTDGNRHFYGFECVNLGNGKDPWPEAQKEAIEKVSAAICRHHGWDERSVIGHKEWQPGKVDPLGFTMDSMRARIGERLVDSKDPTPGPKPATPPKPLPKPQQPTVDLSKLRTAAEKNPSAKGTPVTYSGVKTVEAALVNEGMLARKYSDGHFGEATVQAYAKWQRSKDGGSYRGEAADGIPGRDSLSRLGNKHGFKVVT
jgi:hypothetical protein